MIMNHRSLGPQHVTSAWLFSAFFLVLICCGGPGFAQSVEPYRLQAGDRIRLILSGAVNTVAEVEVGIDGQAAFPVFGRVMAADKTIDSLGDAFFEQDAAPAARHLSPEGEERWIQIRPSEVTLEVISYRPVYLSGNVREPGPITFVPGLSVRQALVAAGGVGSPLLDDRASELKAQTLRAELAKASDRLATRLEMVQEIQARLNLTKLPESKLQSTPNDLQRIMRMGAEDAAHSLNASEIATTQVIAKMQFRRETLQEQREKEEALITVERDRLERYDSLSDRGLVVEEKRSAAERALLLSSSQALETGEEIVRLEIQIAEVSERLAERKRREHAQEIANLRDLEIDIRDLRSQISATRAELSALGLPTLGREQPVIQLFRQNASLEAANVSLETILKPGDVVDVRFDARIDG